MISVPKDSTIPGVPTNLKLYASYETVMFVFDNGADTDLSSYEYELYNQSQISGTAGNYTITGTPLSTGFATANVFTVAVTNSSKDNLGNITAKSYYGRLRSVDTSANNSPWTSLVLTDQDTPLINSQYINSLTASKITAGTIGSHEIILSQSGYASDYVAPANMSVIRSSDYSESPTYSGWIIKGNGDAEFGNLKITGKSLNKILLQSSDIGNDLISIVAGNEYPSWSTQYTSFYADANGKFSIQSALSWDPQAGLSVTGEIQANRGWIGGNDGWLFGNDGILISGSGEDTIGLASGNLFFTGVSTQANIVSIVIDDEFNVYDQNFSTIYLKINRSQLPAAIQADPDLLLNALITLDGFSSTLVPFNGKRFSVQFVSENEWTLVSGVAVEGDVLPGDRIIIAIFGEDQNIDQIHDNNLQNLYTFTSPFPTISFYDTTDVGATSYRIWSGAKNPADANFSLDSDGNLKVNTISVGSSGSSGGIISVGGNYNGAPNPRSVWLSNGQAPPSGTGEIGDIWIAY